jgi:hypothetical protein
MPATEPNAVSTASSRPIRTVSDIAAERNGAPGLRAR